MGEVRNACSILVGNLKGHSEDLGVDWKLILEWNKGKSDGRFRLDASGSG
jgi:hypothetical protein